MMRLFQENRPQTSKLAALRGVGARRAVIAGLPAAAVLTFCVAGGALPVQATTAAHTPTARFTATATAFQNKVIRTALGRIPGGTRISAGKAEWDGSRIVLEVTTPDARTTSAGSAGPADSTCSPGDFCAYSETSYGGCDVVMFQPGPDSFDRAAFSNAECGRAGTWSWKNETLFQVLKVQTITGATPIPNYPYFYTGGTESGNKWCISPGDTNSDVSDEQSRTDGWIALTTNAFPCN